jgi:hypothetical protein
MIGVPHLAMKHYEFVLHSIQNRMNEAGPEYAEVSRGSWAVLASRAS